MELFDFHFKTIKKLFKGGIKLISVLKKKEVVTILEYILKESRDQFALVFEEYFKKNIFICQYPISEIFLVKFLIEFYMMQFKILIILNAKNRRLEKRVGQIFGPRKY